MKRLTRQEWRAVSEALAFRLADDIEDGDIPATVYAEAFDKVQDRIRYRVVSGRSPSGEPSATEPVHVGPEVNGS